MAHDDTVPLHKDLKLSAERRARRGLFHLFPPASRAELWTGLTLIGLSLLGVAWLFKCRCDVLALERDGVTVEGRVVRLWHTTGKGAGFHVAYAYPSSMAVNAPVLQNETTLPKEHFDRLKEGGPVRVTVRRSDPANHQLVGAPPRIDSSAASIGLFLGILLLLTLAGAMNLAWWWLSGRKRVQTQVLVMTVNSAS